MRRRRLRDAAKPSGAPLLLGKTAADWSMRLMRLDARTAKRLEVRHITPAHSAGHPYPADDPLEQACVRY